MPRHLLLEGPDLEVLLAQVFTEYGASARIVRAERLRRGGVAGFFSKESFEVAVEIDGLVEGDAETGESTVEMSSAEAEFSAALGINVAGLSQATAGKHRAPTEGNSAGPASIEDLLDAAEELEDRDFGATQAEASAPEIAEATQQQTTTTPRSIDLRNESFENLGPAPSTRPRHAAPDDCAEALHEQAASFLAAHFGGGGANNSVAAAPAVPSSTGATLAGSGLSSGASNMTAQHARLAAAYNSGSSSDTSNGAQPRASYESPNAPRAIDLSETSGSRYSETPLRSSPDHVGTSNADQFNAERLAHLAPALTANPAVAKILQEHPELAAAFGTVAEMQSAEIERAAVNEDTVTVPIPAVAVPQGFTPAAPRVMPRAVEAQQVPYPAADVAAAAASDNAIGGRRVERMATATGAGSTVNSLLNAAMDSPALAAAIHTLATASVSLDAGLPIRSTPDAPQPTIQAVPQSTSPSRATIGVRPPSGAGDVLVIIGDGVTAYQHAVAIGERMAIGKGKIALVATGSATHGVAGARVVGDEIVARERAARLHAGSTAAVVAVDAPLTTTFEGPHTEWLHDMIGEFEPTAIWAIVDATRRPADLARWLRSVGPVDALAVVNAALTTDLSEILDLGIPIATLDGQPASVETWATLSRSC